MAVDVHQRVAAECKGFRLWRIFWFCMALYFYGHLIGSRGVSHLGGGVICVSFFKGQSVTQKRWSRRLPDGDAAFL